MTTSDPTPLSTPGIEDKIHAVRMAAGGNQFTIALCGDLAEICTLALVAAERSLQNAALELRVQELLNEKENWRMSSVCRALELRCRSLEADVIKLRKAMLKLMVSDRHSAAMSDDEVLAVLVSKEAKQVPIVMERANAVINARRALRETALAQGSGGGAG